MHEMPEKYEKGFFLFSARSCINFTLWNAILSEGKKSFIYSSFSDCT